MERRETAEIDGNSYPVFEVATCRQCGATYLVGTPHKVDTRQRLGQVQGERGKEEYYLLLSRETALDAIDEDEEIGFPEIPTIGEGFQKYTLCAACGAIDRHDSIAPPCQCKSENYYRLIHVPTANGKVFLCPACGRRNPQGTVWRFFVGTDAAASDLGTALYQQIIPAKRSQAAENPQKSEGPWSSTKTDGKSGRTSYPETTDGSRKLLIFSDSRQDAAFFAPYFNRTYNQILRRRLIIKTLEEHKEEAVTNRWRLQDLIDPLREYAEHLVLQRQLPAEEFVGIEPALHIVLLTG